MIVLAPSLEKGSVEVPTLEKKGIYASPPGSGAEGVVHEAIKALLDSQTTSQPQRKASPGGSKANVKVQPRVCEQEDRFRHQHHPKEGFFPEKANLPPRLHQVCASM